MSNGVRIMFAGKFRGREISKTRLNELISYTNEVILEMGIGNHVAVICYGSAGCNYLVRNSDTDFSLLDDGTLSMSVLIDFQRRLYKATGTRFIFACKSWERIKVNPMDVLSIKFLCGNYELFDRKVVYDDEITNRVMIEHLHTFNGRAKKLRHEAPRVDDFVNLVFDTIPSAEQDGVHVKVLPLDHLRAGGPNDRMNFLNVLPDGNITVSNAIIHSSHEDFRELCIGRLDGDHIRFDRARNHVLSERYMFNFQEQCQSCCVKSICRGSVQRYLFITHDSLPEWDNLRCQYFRGIISRWFDDITETVITYMSEINESMGFVCLETPKDKIHYPMFVMKGGLSLSFKKFT